MAKIKRNGRAFCEKCDRKVPYTVEDNLTKQTIHQDNRKITFFYTEMAAICDNCGSELYVDAINDANAVARQKAFDKAK